MSELEFLNALHVELLRHDAIRAAGSRHELFQTSTIVALLGGAFDGDVTLNELLEHGDLGLGTLNGLDGELVVIDGQVFKAELDCTLRRPGLESRTPYAVVVPFSPGPERRLHGPIDASSLEGRLWPAGERPRAPTSIRIDGHFDLIRVRSVPRQTPPYPSLSEAIAHEHRLDLRQTPGTMVGFCFPDDLRGIEMVGFHLHFADESRSRGGHVLAFVLREGTVRLDEATDLHVELPATVAEPDHGDPGDQATLRRLEGSS